MGEPNKVQRNSNTPFEEMKLIALFAFAAIAVAHSAPEDSAVAENFAQSAPEIVESQDDDYNMSAENMLAELNGKSWKSLEAEFNQLSKTRTATPKWPRCSPSKRWPRWTPRSWASSPWTPCTRTNVPSLNKCTQHQKRSPSRATWWPPTPRWSHAQAGIAGAHTPMSLTGGVLFK